MTSPHGLIDGTAEVDKPELLLNEPERTAACVWVWTEKPSGMFAPWNPRVTPASAPNATVMSHQHRAQVEDDAWTSIRAAWLLIDGLLWAPSPRGNP